MFKEILKSLQSVIQNKSDFMAIVKKCDDFTTILGGVTEDNLQASFALSQLNMCAKAVSLASEIADTIIR